MKILRVKIKNHVEMLQVHGSGVKQKNEGFENVSESSPVLHNQAQ